MLAAILLLLVVLAGCDSPNTQKPPSAKPSPVIADEASLEISLPSITTTMDQDGLQRFHGRPWGEANAGSSSNLFLVDAPTIGDAINASSGVIVGERSADFPVALNMPDPPRGSHWLVVFLGVGPSDTKWIVDGASIHANRIRFAYHKRQPGPENTDVHYYWYWVPLGKLEEGVYTLELYETGLSAVTLMRRVGVTASRQ